MQLAEPETHCPTIEELEADESFRPQLAGAPDWFNERCERAWQKYLDSQAPSRGEETWRYTSLKRLNIEGARICHHPYVDDWRKRSELIHAVSGRAMFAAGRLVGYEIAPELAEQGVEFCPLQEALERNPEGVKRMLELATPLEDRFSLLGEALCTDGVWLHVPDGVQVEAPFFVCHWLGGEHHLGAPLTLLSSGRNARLSYVDMFVGETAEQNGYVLSQCISHAGENSQLTRKYIQNHGGYCKTFHREDSFVERDAQLENITINLGSHYARLDNRVTVNGSGADAKLSGLTVAQGEQEFDQRTLQVHNAPNTTSDLLYKNALQEKGRTIFSGLIRVGEEAQQTDAYQTNRNLILSETAEANSLPGLEIEANDVKCSHGATSAQLNPEELYYLRARGIPVDEAERLLILGFLEEIIQRIDSEELRNTLSWFVQQRFEQDRQPV